VALSQLGNVGPELGQGYIIDSFLVVVLGGVGQLAGSVAAASGLGIFNKILEPQMGAVLGKILILVMIILFIETPAGSVRAESYRLMSQPITLTLAQRAPRPLRWLGILLVLGLLSMPFLALLPASIRWRCRAADAERQNPLLRHCGGGAGSGLGLCGHAVAGARDLLCPRRVRHGDVPDAPGGGRRSAGVYVFLSWSELPWFWWARSISPGRWRWWCWFPVCWPGFRLVFSLEDQGVYFSIMTQALTSPVCCCSFATRPGLAATTASPVLPRCWVSGHATGTRAGLFMATVLLLLLTLWLGSALAQSKFGRILTAVRDAENRLMFCGYDPRGFKLLVWTLSAVLCGLAGRYARRWGSSTPAKCRRPTPSRPPSGWRLAGAAR
jgi:urea transport system permease protein